MLPGGLQVRVKAPSDASDSAVVSSWTLPAYGVVNRSPSIMGVTGNDLVVMLPRIAKALGIRNGQTVEFEIVGLPGERVVAPVTIKDGIGSDVLLHDLMHLGLVAKYEAGASGETITTHSGKRLHIEMQAMWAGMRVVPACQGIALLHVDGASRNNPKGPCGYGFRITAQNGGHELVRGYGHGGMNRSNNEMEYVALLEGLIWANRLFVKELKISSDSQLILRQVIGEYQVKNPRLQELHAKVLSLVNKIKENAQVSIKHIPREQNTIADCLANFGVDTRENVTACNWGNVNRFIAGGA